TLPHHAHQLLHGGTAHTHLLFDPGFRALLERQERCERAACTGQARGTPRVVTRHESKSLPGEQSQSVPGQELLACRRAVRERGCLGGGAAASPAWFVPRVGPGCLLFAFLPRSLFLPPSGRTTMRHLLCLLLLTLFPSLLCAAGLPIYLWHEPEWFDGVD